MTTEDIQIKKDNIIAELNNPVLPDFKALFNDENLEVM
jgi:hypothetical protein